MKETDEERRARQEAIANEMRFMSPEKRERLIKEAGSKVLDLRPALDERLKQRELAKLYKRGYDPTKKDDR